jgi:hypothetical protein
MPEDPGDRRIALLRAGYAVFDTTGDGRRGAKAPLLKKTQQRVQIGHRMCGAAGDEQVYRQ